MFSSCRTLAASSAIPTAVRNSPLVRLAPPAWKVEPRKIRAEKVGRGRWDLTITISEGRNREVRRMCEALGLEVDRLLRVKFGPVELGDLAPGKVRSLTKAERAALDKL